MQAEAWQDEPPAERQAHIAQFQCLIPCAIDQDPYFRLLRDNCHRMQRPSPKPALIHSKFLTGLHGAGGKMSASDESSAIFMSDTPAQIKKKINKSFSGGGATLEEHQKNGGNPDVDVAYQYITYFEEDDAKIQKLADEYRAGTLSTGEMKKICIELLQDYVKGYQERRALVTDEVLASYMKPRKLTWPRSHTLDALKPKEAHPDGKGGKKKVKAKKENKGSKEEKKAATVPTEEKKVDETAA
jgi:tryptophanyl-tRNA synthetase